VGRSAGTAKTYLAEAAADDASRRMAQGDATGIRGRFEPARTP